MFQGTPDWVLLNVFPRFSCLVDTISNLPPAQKHPDIQTMSISNATVDAPSSENSIINVRPKTASPYNIMDGVETDVRDHDVLWGRTKIAHAHGGNATFRRLIRQHREEYQSTRVREEKAKVVRTIMSCISSTGGRFLKSVDDEGKTWFEVDSTQTYDKVSHALRSAKPIKKSSNMKKPVMAIPVVSAKIPVEEATYENLLVRQKNLLESFKAAHKQQQEQHQYSSLPRCCSIEASADLLKDLDRFLGKNAVFSIPVQKMYWEL